MTEDEHQEKIFEWVEAAIEKYPQLEMLYANMNGVRRSKRYTAKLKRRGMKAGIPDMFLPVARHGYHGLYIELKRPATEIHRQGYTSKPQKKWLKQLKEQGYYAVVCYGWDDAKQVLIYYLEEIKHEHN